ncbi:MAG: hypothetical protein WAM60_12070 [Candidatus Promineifilaceae bacterium]
MTRTEWVLGILLAILLIFIAVLGVIFWLQPGNSNRAGSVPVAPTSPFAGQTAIEAFLYAQAEAVKWQPDAGLLKASATWPQGTSRETLLQGKTSWDFTYYSPASQMTAVVSVVNEEATLGSTHSSTKALAAMDSSNWRVDSQEAILSLLNSGGGQFIDQNGVSTLTASLSYKTEENRTEWFLSLFSVSNGNSYTALIDATSGEIISVIE